MTEIFELSTAHERPVQARWLMLVLAVSVVLIGLGGWAIWPRATNSGFTIDVPPSPPPAVHPLELKPVDFDTARDINAAVPFIAETVPPAKPFHLTGSDNDKARATDCLAAALFYEAGAEQVDGQKAVAQVILNRVRHPAFPASVCGVVYQGATRATGCQFSFSCDGSMRRRPSASLWAQLRGIAISMLHGEVYAPVGLATHYHTDWVVPYWSAKLDKIRAEQSHLFFRWQGWWGTPTAFRQPYAGTEPLVARMAGLSTAHANAQPGEVALDAGGVMPGLAGLSTGPIVPARFEPVFASPAGNFLIFAADPHSDPAGLATAASAACGSNSFCKVMVWTDRRDMPTSLPVSDTQRDHMAFSYLRDPKSGTDKPLWNCAQFNRPDPGQCMRQTLPLPDIGKSNKPAILPKGAAVLQRAPPEEREVLIPITPDVPTDPQPGDRLKPSSDSFSGRRRPGTP